MIATTHPTRIQPPAAMYCRYRSTLGYVVLTAELIFIFVYLCQLHFNIMSVVKLQKKYFTQIWNILDCMYMIFSLAYIVIYLYRFEVSSFSLCFCLFVLFQQIIDYKKRQYKGEVLRPTAQWHYSQSRRQALFISRQLKV